MKKILGSLLLAGLTLSNIASADTAFVSCKKSGMDLFSKAEDPGVWIGAFFGGSKAPFFHGTMEIADDYSDRDRTSQKAEHGNFIFPVTLKMWRAGEPGEVLVDESVQACGKSDVQVIEGHRAHQVIRTEMQKVVTVQTFAEPERDIIFKMNHGINHVHIARIPAGQLFTQVHFFGLTPRFDFMAGTHFSAHATQAGFVAQISNGYDCVIAVNPCSE